MHGGWGWTHMDKGTRSGLGNRMRKYISIPWRSGYSIARFDDDGYEQD